MPFEKIDAKQQRKIIRNWAELFPSYKKETNGCLSRRVGPIVLSIWHQMGRGSTEYYIRFTEFALVRENERPCVTLKSTPTSRSDLPWVFHEQGIYKRLAQELREVAFVPMEGTVTLSQVIDAYKKKLSEEWIGEYALEDLVLIPAWAGREELAKEMLQWCYDLFIKDIIKLERIEYIKRWRDTLEEKIKNSQRLREIVDENVEKLKLTKIPYEDLIIDC